MYKMTYLPLPLGEGSPVIPLPLGEARVLISLSLWERVGERDLRSPKTLPLFPLPKGKGMKRHLLHFQVESANEKCQMTYGKSSRLSPFAICLRADSLGFGLPGGELNQGSQPSRLAILKSYSTLHYLEQSSANDNSKFVKVGSSSPRRVFRIKNSQKILYWFPFIIYLNPQARAINLGVCPDALPCFAPAHGPGEKSIKNLPQAPPVGNNRSQVRLQIVFKPHFLFLRRAIHSGARFAQSLAQGKFLEKKLSRRNLETR